MNCVKSLIAQTVLPDEIVIIDGGTNNKLRSELEWLLGSSITLKYIKTDAGLTRQRNIGVKSSTGDIVFCLDDDVILENNFIEEIVKVFKNDQKSEVGGVMGDITNIRRAEGRFYNLFRRLFFLPHFGNGNFLPSGFPTFIHGETEVTDVECLSGGLTAYRRRVFADFSWDENLTGYSYLEDDDFSYRISRKYRNIYTPFARLAHFPSKLGREDIRTMKKQLIQHHYYLFKKNFPQDVRHRAAFYLSIVGLALESVPQSFARRSIRPFLGILDGLITIVRRRENTHAPHLSLDKRKP